MNAPAKNMYNLNTVESVLTLFGVVMDITMMDTITVARALLIVPIV